MHFAFVSYATPNIAWARRVQAAIKVFALEAYVAEESWTVGLPPANVIQAVQSAGIVIVVWDKAAAASEWVRHEVGAADGAKVPLAFIVTEAGAPLPKPVLGAKYADATKDPITAILQIQSVVLGRYWQLMKAHNERMKQWQEQQRQAQEAQANQTGGFLLFAGLVLAALSAKK